MLPVFELDRFGKAHTHVNSYVVEWQTHQRDVLLADHECHLQIKVSTSHIHSQTRYNIHTNTARWYPPRVMYTSRWAWKNGVTPRYKANPIKTRKPACVAQPTNHLTIQLTEHDKFERVLSCVFSWFHGIHI